MSKFAANTTGPIEKTRAEIEGTVRRYGADAFVSGWEGERAFIQFRCEGRFVRFVMTLPDREDEKFTSYMQGSTRFRRTDSAITERWEQACRQKWRALALMIKAKLEAIDSGIVTFEEEFLAHVLMPDGRSLYEHAKAPLAVAYESGEVRPLLPGPKTIQYRWRSMAEAPQNESVIVYAGTDPGGKRLFVGEASHRVIEGEDQGWWWVNQAPADFDPSDPIYPIAWTPLPDPPRFEVAP